MEFLIEFLPIAIYFLLIILIIIGIIIGIKLIITMNKVESIIENVETKVNSLNGVFNILEMASCKISGVYERITDFFIGLADKLFFKKKEREEDENE